MAELVQNPLQNRRRRNRRRRNRLNVRVEQPQDPALLALVAARRGREDMLKLVCLPLSFVLFAIAVCFLTTSTEGLKKLEKDFPFYKYLMKLPINMTWWVFIFLMVIFPLFCIIMQYLYKKKPFVQAVLKFGAGLVLPAFCFKAGAMAEGDISFFLFLELSATCIVFVLLAFQTTEDFGITDMLVAMAMAFCMGNDGIIWWEATLGSLPASFKAFIPFILKYFDCSSGFDEDAIRENWKINGITPDEFIAFLQELRVVSETLDAARKIARTHSELFDHIRDLERRLPPPVRN